MQSKFLLFFLFLLALPLISANGLNISSGNFQSVEKVYGDNSTLSFSIHNQEDFVFYDINLKDNDYLSMDTIQLINPGETINFTINITSDTSFNTNFNILGYKDANIGASNASTTIEVDYDNGLSVCQKTLIIGDTITWNNLVIDEIQLWNANTNQEVATIAQGSNYTRVFNMVDDFAYYFKRHGTVIFTDTCTLSVRSDTGRVNYPEYDASFSANVTINYLDTELNVNVLERDYILDFDEEAEGVITIKNIGSQVAKVVHLNGKWFEFNKNNFDIQPDQTIIVNYIIDPPIYKTNDTDKIYNHSVNITGNFETSTEEFSISINYAEISSDAFNGTSIQGILAAFCMDNPETLGCIETKIIYKNIETGEYEFNVTYNEKQVNDLWDYMFAKSDSQEIFEAFLKERMEGIYVNISSITSEMDSLSESVDADRQEREDSEDTSINSLLIVLFAMIIGLSGFLTFLAIKWRRHHSFGDLWR